MNRSNVLQKMLVGVLAVCGASFWGFGAKYYAIEDYNRCEEISGIIQPDVNVAADTAQGWYDTVTGSRYWTKKGRRVTDGVTVEKLTDDDSVSAPYGRDRNYADKNADAFWLSIHGDSQNTAESYQLPRWYVRDKSVDGEERCIIDLYDTRLGDGHIRYLHLMICKSLEDDQLVGWQTYWGSNKLRVVTGFHGIIELWDVLHISSTEGRAEDFADDLLDGMPVSEAWLQNFDDHEVKSDATGETGATCPTAMSVGKYEDEACERVNQARYTSEAKGNTIGESAGDVVICASAYDGCDPAGENAWE